MKKTLTLIVALLLYSSYVFPQYCGDFGNPSGSGQCTASGTLSRAGFTPSEDIPCIYRNQAQNTVIEFKNFDTIAFGGQVVTVQWLSIDSISNLPDGLCWATNKANNRYNNQETGCIKLSGITSAPPGQYKLRLIFTANIGVPVTSSAEAAGIILNLRVVDQSLGFCPPVDTAQTTAYQPFSGNYENVVQITGRLFYDENNNQTYETGEQGIGGKIIDIGNGYVAATNANGNYYGYVPAGTYSMKLNQRIQFNHTPDSLVVNATNLGTSYDGNDFAVVIPQGFCDGYLTVTSTSPPPRPGFNNRIVYSYTNTLSAGPVSLTAMLRYNNDEVFVSATPTPDIVDTVTRTLQWSVNSVASNNTWHTEIIFYTPPTVPLSTIRYYTGSVLSSSCPGMDTALVQQQVQVVGSYDPNDKAVSPAGFGTDGRIIPSTGALKYTIRFQNTGTYMAENVKVIDTISTLLDLSSFKLMATSHPCEVIIKGHEVTFAFNGIQLADSFSNEPASHGYIQYSINPLPAFVNGSVITNRADIYFDFNAPILTNTTRTTGDINAGISRIEQNVFEFTIYPNPNSSSTLQLEADPQLIGEVVEIKDINGRLISRTPITATNITLPLTDMPAGVYLVKAGNLVKRLVRE